MYLAKLLWDFKETGWDVDGYRQNRYMPFRNINDLINQFNYIGYHDVCIYPPMGDMAYYPDNKVNDYKGVHLVYYGHSEKNQTGK